MCKRYFMPALLAAMALTCGVAFAQTVKVG
jgi:hypothetical protein